MAECHARLMAVAKHGTTEAFSATLAGVLHRAELSISNAYDAGAKSIQIEAIGACGVSGPLVGQPQAVPDLSQLTERGAVAWAGVDAQGLRDGGASPSANAGEPVAIRPDIQAVLAMLDVPVIARLSSHEGKLLKPGQEPPAFESAVPLVREWDHRRACETIIAALSGRMTKENK